MQYLKRSTSVDIKLGPFLDETDGKTAETALVITQPDIRLSKNGANFIQKNGAQTLAHNEKGWYTCTLNGTDTNTLGRLIVAVHESGALPVWCEFTILPINVFDSFITGSDYLDVDAIGLDAANGELASIPTTISSLRQMTQYLFEYFRNKKTVTTTTETVFKEDASTPLGTAGISDDGSTFTKNEMS